MSAQIKLVRFEVGDETRLSGHFLLAQLSGYSVQIRIFGQIRDKILSWNSLPRPEGTVLSGDCDRLCGSEYGKAVNIKFDKTFKN